MPANVGPVSLFIPCLVDTVYPEIGLAVGRLLRHLGFEVRYDARQTCCGQPAFNAGQWAEARRVASGWLDVFAGAGAVVCPSGSCTAMVRKFYATLFADDAPRRTQAEMAARNLYEFAEFLTRTGTVDRLSGTWKARVGFHNSCHNLRELRLHREHQRLLARVAGADVVEVAGEPVCCGFGGLFSAKFEPIAASMGKSRLDAFVALGVDLLVVNDPGCLMHLRQEARARQLPLPILHTAEFVAQSMGLLPQAPG